MVTVLAFSTSASRGSVALEGRWISVSADWEDARGHAERVLVAADDVLARAGIDRAALEAVACDVGPGSFTGVRVAVATAKGVALALDLPLVGVGSLETMAFAAFDGGLIAADAIALPILDARRGEVFIAAYDARLAAVLAAAHVPRDRVADAIAPLLALGRPVFGIGAFAAEALAATSTQVLASPACDHPAARSVARLASTRVGVDPAVVEPVYLRPPDAKLPPR